MFILPKGINNQGGSIHLAILLAIIGLIVFLIISSAAPFKDKLFSVLYPKPSSFAAGKYTSMHVDSQDISIAGSLGCVSEDSHVYWGAAGSLNPGETFTYNTPYQDCQNDRSIRVIVSSDGRDPSSSWVELSTVIPGQTGYPGTGKKIYATTHPDSSSAELCMFPRFDWPPQTYSFTLKNISSKTINNITVTGKDNNGWTPTYTRECWRSDADNDGFSDALEQGMEFLWSGGSDYAISCGTPTPDDELDFYPADFNDDGKVDSIDVDRITAYLGQGTGIPMQSISNSHPMDPPDGYYTQIGAWREFDLDADGLITQDDVNLIKALVGKDVCATGNPNPVLPPDTTPPGVAISYPYALAMPAGYTQLTQALAFDNVKVAKVEFYVNGSLKCTDTDTAVTASTYDCSFRLKGKSGTKFNIQAKAYDGVGNSSSSRILTVTSF